ncbi:heme biosynthesis HemY N-terminal domain-containing protein [Neptuniibacter sp. 2_MG-2023]|uniref:heme biosynthesis HemY N-terminal domain-containing protein n=1 Tax=Neptuniibacter sp. 2_MG-2023 TaxID=3062671 RepID=UPI0026E26252|nr:heme biosynthesis HemY N-terminal domain-containing protein [Neptuniibacter sp. 2_MG-2023]MDO6514907.1 heme biosynthesis HemY N-terminal domain-containing protein [Neptuniibacter sp. 2_MG-2023]
MKILFLILLVILGAGAFVGELMIQDSGYVLIAYNQTTIETSLWVLLVALLITFILLHWIINVLTHTKLPTAKLKAWKDHRNHLISRRKTLKGLTSLSEGNWAQAQKQLAQAAERSDLPLVNYLAAARAAHEQNNEQATDELLQKARNSTPEAEVTVAISQAEIQLSRGQLEPCLATLLRLRTLAPKNTYVMKLLKDIYLRLNDWQALSKLIPVLRKHQALNDEKLTQLSRECYSQLLDESVSKLPVETSNDDRLKALGKAWSDLPSELSRDGDLVQRYTELLVSLGAEGRAEQNLRDLIKRNWNEQLVNLYGRLSGENAKKQLDTARGWLKSHDDSPSLQLTLGRLSMRNQHWGQAVKYFEHSLELSPSSETLAELARLLRHLGDGERAQALLQQNLNLVASGLPELPMPEQEKA